jgi:hypothetical protein
MHCPCVRLWAEAVDACDERSCAKAVPGAFEPQAATYRPVCRFTCVRSHLHARRRRVQQARRLLRDGELSACQSRLLFTGIHDPHDPDIRQQLLSLHPPCRRAVPAAPPPSGARLGVHLRQTFRGARRHKATGPSGSRNEYLRVLAMEHEDVRASCVISEYEHFAELLVNGDLPAWFSVAWSSARVVPLRKLVKRQARARAPPTGTSAYRHRRVPLHGRDHSRHRGPPPCLCRISGATTVGGRDFWRSRHHCSRPSPADGPQSAQCLPQDRLRSGPPHHLSSSHS